MLFLLPGLLPAQDMSSTKINYISANHVYLATGYKSGLTVGDTVQVWRNSQKLADLVIVHCAANSASARPLAPGIKFKVGDRVQFKANLKVATVHDTLTSRKRTFTVYNSQPRRSKTRITGSVSVQGYWFKDGNNGKYDFNQPAVRLRLRGRNLLTEGFNLNLRFRSRYDRRSRRFEDRVPQNEWRNRLYEAALIYEKPAAPLYARLGRIISPNFSGIGYIDGMLLQHNLSEHLNWGFFAGTQPEWQYSDFQTSYQKYGLFTGYKSGSYATRRMEVNLSLAGVYHGKNISREFLYLRSSYSYASNWSVYQTLELDLNRGWRKTRSNESIGLSGLYINGQYRWSDWLRTGLSYDNRKNYYTYELRSIADSLFDDAFRQGIRLHSYLTLTRNWRLSLNAGVRHRQSDTRPTYTFGFRATRRNLLWRSLTAAIRFSGFNNFYGTGYHPSLSLFQRFRKGHNISLAYGTYMYNLSSNSGLKINQWLRLQGQYELPANLYLSGSYEYDLGDDVEGQRMWAELGYYF